MTTSYDPGRLFGHYDQFANDDQGEPLPAVGYVEIVPDPLVVRAADGSTILSGSFDVDLDGAGDWEVSVPPLGDDVDPVNVSYTVIPHLEHANLDPVVGVTVEAGGETNVNEWTSVLDPGEPQSNAQHLAEVARQGAEDAQAGAEGAAGQAANYASAAAASAAAAASPNLDGGTPFSVPVAQPIDGGTP